MRVMAVGVSARYPPGTSNDGTIATTEPLVLNNEVKPSVE